MNDGQDDASRWDVLERVEPLESVVSASGKMRIYAPRPAVLVVVMEREVDAATVDVLTRAIDHASRRTPNPPVFFDLQHVVGYTTEARRNFTRWAQHERSRLGELHTLMRKPIMKMGVALVAAATQPFGIKIIVHGDAGSFEGALLEACKRSDRTG